MQLRLAITDLYGNVMTRLDRFTNAVVTIPWNDARTASVDLNIFDPAALNVRPLERMLKVWLAQEGQTDLIFWGPLIEPEWKLHEDKVTVQAHDLAIRLKNHYLNARDKAVTTPGTDPDDYQGSVPVSFVGARRLRDAGKNASAENGASIPDLGIVNGTNTHPGAAKSFPQASTVGDQVYPATVLVVTDQTLFPSTGGTIYLAATLGPAPDYTVTGASQTLTYEGKSNDSDGNPRWLTGVDGWTGSGTLDGGTSVIDGAAGKYKRMLCARGENVWDKLQELVQLPDGPDIELEPFDGDYVAPADGLEESADVPQTVGTGPFALQAESVITVADPGYAEQINVSVWLERDVVDDVSLLLIAPDEREIRLTAAGSTTGENLGTGIAGVDRTIFDDNATYSIEDPDNAVAPYEGYFRPRQALSGLRDMAVAGDWTLQVWADDLASGDGTLHNWAINFVPDDDPPVTPPYAKLNTYAKTDYAEGGPKDKSETVRFTYGFHHDNVEEFTYSPAGGSVRNRVVAVTNNTGGDGTEAGTGATQSQTRTNLESRQRFGNYVQWEAAGSLAKAADPADVLGEIATYWVEALAYPPQGVEFTPKVAPAYGSTLGLMLYMRDFVCGDLVTVAARAGYARFADPTTGDDTDTLIMMVREVGVKQKDEAGNTATSVTAIPFVQAPVAAELEFVGAVNDNFAGNLVEHDGYLYWPTSAGNIGRVATDGTGLNQTFINVSGDDANDVFVTDTHIYWATLSSGAVGRALLDGTSVTQTFIDSGDGAYKVVADSTHIYYINNGGAKIGRANINGTGLNTTFVTAPAGPNFIALTATHVYWTDADGDVGRCELGGANLDTTLITGLDDPQQLIFGDGLLYVIDNGDGTIWRSNPDGTGLAANFIADDVSAGTFWCCADGADHIFWTNSSAASVNRAGLDGAHVLSPMFVITLTNNTPGPICSDGTYVYWANVNDGSIGRVPTTSTGASPVSGAEVADG